MTKKQLKYLGYFLLIVIFLIVITLLLKKYWSRHVSLVDNIVSTQTSTKWTPSQIETTTLTSSVSENSYQVTKVVDGDTLDILKNGQVVRVRLLGVDTPETVDPRKPVQCFGQEASLFTKNQLLDKNISLEQDPSQATYDKYGRLLAYVILPDGSNFNLKLVRDSYAHEYTYHSIPYKYQTEFKHAEEMARESKLGLWGPTCQN